VAVQTCRFGYAHIGKSSSTNSPELILSRVLWSYAAQWQDVNMLVHIGITVANLARSHGVSA